MAAGIPAKVALRAAYDYLRKVAFFDIPLPKRVQLSAKPLRDAYGYYYNAPHRIVIDSRLLFADQILRVMAHEMCHASLEQAGECDHHVHDQHFKELGNIACERMGWQKTGF